jgi:hypothetical protein
VILISNHRTRAPGRPRGEADALGLAYDFVATWITLEVRTALDAVGLTGAVARALG